jgi:hypothetical protein
MAIVQIFFAILLAFIPFHDGLSEKNRLWLTVGLMLGNGLFAYSNSLHRRDADLDQQRAWARELGEKKEARKKLGDLTSTEEAQVEDACNAVRAAETNKAVIIAQLAACDRKCPSAPENAARQNDAILKTAQENLQRISSLRSAWEQAEMRALTNFAESWVTEKSL